MALQDLTPQLRTRLRRVEKIVGLFITLATLVLVSGFVYYLYHTAERKGWFVAKCPYFTYVASAEGLKVGDPIVLMGFSVGQITIIEAQPPYSYYHVFVGFEIKRPYYGYILKDSKARVATADFLGRRQLEVTTGEIGPETVHERNSRVYEILVDRDKDQYALLSKAPKGVFLPPDEQPALTERAEKLVSQVETALPNILSLTNQVYTVLTNTSALVANLNQTVVDAQPVISNVNVITTNLRDPHGSLGEWLIPTNLNAQLSSTLTSANTNLDVLAASLNQTLLNLADITSNLNHQVQVNDHILGQISSLVVDTDNLVQGLKRHWLLRGLFQKKTTTNAPPASAQPARPAEQRK
jgi:ABC-type transporter Mla subunit MlaD